MKKNILTHGLISGIIVSVIMLFSMNYYSYCEGSVNQSTSMLIGYASMLIAFSMIFVGIRNYRDKYNDGIISFGKAFKIGILIALIASTIYVVSWLVCYFFFMPDFLDKYSTREIENMKINGATAAEIEVKIKEMAKFATMYKNPFFNAMMTYAEILPVGLIVTLISSLILKRKAKNSGM
ncbi:DUF4199 domain-containing protein [Pedobacter montanisoli]|uniref:DUF4199 domain-containing protein n=1 Tax=Pedobacter montanisoli TaxID=2923277 RepID=A0ABS9ZYX2_9SPHI|nr:DUF4199 domain-containing protein [Pedobacter montanisoli]MCJ0743505.1 DUF4199 domain-containing protein [Pedobacter montanisoli]